VHSSGATGQDDAVARGRVVCSAFDLQAHVIDLTGVHASIKETVDKAVGITGEDWASGQLVAYARTPAFYYTTSLLTQEGLGGILLGTTNRDEGAYLGYVGKASDGMVDVQLIADLHKDEVRAIASVLGLPDSIIEATPTGDMYDGRDDEEVFGATYPFVKLYLNFLCWPTVHRNQFLAGLDSQARAQFEEMSAHLEKLHRYNAHKYLSKSPAIHLNLLASGVPGGWPS
jgi:NAD+ synthetase